MKPNGRQTHIALNDVSSIPDPVAISEEAILSLCLNTLSLLGSDHKQRKKYSKYCYPWRLSDADINAWTRMTKIDFLEFCQENKTFVHLKCGLNHYAALFLVLIRLRKAFQKILTIF